MTSRVLAVIGILTATGAGAEWLSRPEPEIVRAPLSQLSKSFESWRGTEFPLDGKVLRTLGVDDHLSRVYERPGMPPVSLYIGFYASQRTGETIHSPLKCLPGTGWQPIETGRREFSVIDASGRAEHLLINRYVVQKGLDRHIVLFWYQMRGRVVASEYTAKLFLIDGALRTNRTDGALVRVIVPLRDNDTEASADAVAASFIRSLYPQLAVHLPA